jgi:anti-sigma-K factor RskA
VNELHDLAPGYAVGALTDAERDAFEAHLATCEPCQSELAVMDEAVEALGFSDAEQPPDGLGARVMQSIDEAPQIASLAIRRRTRPAVWFGAVAAVLVLVLGAALGVMLRESAVDRVITAADAITVTVPATAAGDAGSSVQLVYSPSQEMGVLTAADLTTVASEATYQMWLIGADGPVSAGLFTPNVDGNASVLIEGVPQPGLVFGVTIEPSGGSPQPTGDVLFAAEV